MKINNHDELEVFQQSFAVAMEIFQLTQSFPKYELYSLTDQIRRSSRSVCANISEAFRKRFFTRSFIAKINDCEGEAAETQVWIKFSASCNYISKEKAIDLLNKYDQILGKLVIMRKYPEKWSINH